MSPRLSAILAVAALAAPAALAAQTAVTGTVVDSTRAQAPLAGATVQLVSRLSPDLVRTVATDSLGGYMLLDVPAGEYLLGFLHPRLDELALQPPLRLVRTADSVRSNRQNRARIREERRIRASDGIAELQPDPAVRFRAVAPSTAAD